MSKYRNEKMERTYSRYKKLQREIDDIETLMRFCGICYPKPDEEAGTDHVSFQITDTEPKTISDKIKMRLGRYSCSTTISFVLPKSLQLEVMKLLNEYRLSAIEEIQNMDKDLNDESKDSVYEAKEKILNTKSQHKKQTIIKSAIGFHNYHVETVARDIGMSSDFLKAVMNHNINISSFRFIEIADFYGYTSIDEFTNFVNGNFIDSKKKV